MVKKALYDSLPVMAGYLVLGTGFGILMRAAGYGVLWAAAMSIFIYAGSMQYVGVGLLTGGASVITAALTTFMVNARHIFYSISMIDRYRSAGIFRPYLIFALTDETYSIVSSDGLAPGRDTDRYRFFLSLFNHSYWILGTLIGAVIGPALPFSTMGIEFSMTALFVASFTEQWIVNSDHLPAAAGIVSTFVCLILFRRDYFLIPSMLLISFILSLVRGKGGEKI